MTKPTIWHVRPVKTQISLSAEAQADLSLRWAHSHFVRFVMRRLIYTSAEPPYFKNLPNTVVMKQVDVLISGVSVTTLTVTDRNPDDASGLSVRMNPDWIDVFTFDTNTCKNY